VAECWPAQHACQRRRVAANRYAPDSCTPPAAVPLTPLTNSEPRVFGDASQHYATRKSAGDLEVVPTATTSADAIVMRAGAT
jgi:hypothetical protein